MSMKRLNLGPGSGIASSIDRVISPVALRKLKRSRLTEKLFPSATFVQQRSAGIDAPIRRSNRIAQREDDRASPFLALPPEIRDRIFDYACTGLSIRFRHVNMRVGAVYGAWSTGDDQLFREYTRAPDHSKAMGHGLPAWMLLSKQLLFECLQQFHRNAKFFYLNDFESPLVQKGKSLGLLRFDQAKVVDLSEYQACYLDIWEQTDKDSVKYRIFGLEAEAEAIFRQATYYLALSPVLQDLTIKLCYYSMVNCANFDLSVQNIRSGIAFFDQLPKGLHKVTFVLKETRNMKTRFVQTHEAVKEELRRITKTLVSTPGEEYDEAVVCSLHGRDSETCCLATNDIVWGFMATSLAYRRARNFCEGILVRDG